MIARLALMLAWFALAAAWAWATSGVVPFPAVHSAVAGAVIAMLGAGLIVAAVRELARHDGALVQTGPYRWVANPMDIGLTLMCAGASIAAGSASGLWLVTPVVALAAAVFAYGHERAALIRRFGPDAARVPLLSFPRGGIEPATAAHRAAVCVWVLIPWVLTWFGTQALGRAPDWFYTSLAFERDWPVWEWTQVLYLSAYLFTPITVLFVVRTQRALRRFAVSGAIATIIVTLCWLTIPVVADNRAFVPTTALGHTLALAQAHSIGVAAFPSFHVLWCMIAAAAWQRDGMDTNRPWLDPIAWTWAVLIALSTLTTGQHTVIDALAAIPLFILVRDPEATWHVIRSRTERIANSWREWRLGPVRIVSHAMYAAAAGAVAMTIAAMAVGPAYLNAIAWVALCAFVGATIWARAFGQLPAPLRSSGRYGAAVGGAIGASMAPLFGASVVHVLAAFALAAPWAQVLAKVRCLVQGCCHGGVAPDAVGIRYRRSRSHVAQFTNLAGRPLHATPVYSIAAHVVIGIVLLRLRFLGASDVLLLGIWLIAVGLARFVEEGFRAEPFVAPLIGLRRRQWLGVASVLAGVACTTLPLASASSGFDAPTPSALGVALVVAVIAGLAMGVDFPRSNRPLARLAPAD